ncbi:COG1470 family protein [Streptomyces sp. NPDC001514]
MTTSAHLDASPASVLPGEEARIPLEIRNGGNVVEAYGFEVLGPAADWSVVEPATLSLNPGTGGQVELVVRPPRDTTVPPGELTYGVRVLPQEQPQYATVPEGVLYIRPYADFTAELTPRLGQGRTGARFQVALDNRGNYPLSVALSGKDQGDLLKFGLPSGPTVVEPGRAAFVKLPVKPKRWMWRGVAVPHVFQVIAAPSPGPEGAPEVAPEPLDGSLLQRPLVSAGLLKLLIALLVLLGVLAGLWFGLLRPVVRSAAKEAVKAPVEAAESKAAEAKEAADEAKEASSAGAGGGKPGPGGSGAPSPSGSATPGTGPAPLPQAALFSHRLTPSAPAGGTAAATYTVPDGKVLRLTDLVMENPQGDAGTITLSVGDKPLLAPALENFREQDFHWASAILAGPKQKITVTLACRTVGRPPSGPAPDRCHSAVLFSGTLE